MSLELQAQLELEPILAVLSGECSLEDFLLQTKEQHAQTLHTSLECQEIFGSSEGLREYMTYRYPVLDLIYVDQICAHEERHASVARQYGLRPLFVLVHHEDCGPRFGLVPVRGTIDDSRYPPVVLPFNLRMICDLSERRWTIAEFESFWLEQYRVASDNPLDAAKAKILEMHRPERGTARQ